MRQPWPEEFASGIDEMDQAQREMFDQVGQLITSCEDGRGLEQVQQLLHYLQTGLVSYFETEEALMKATCYPEGKRHRQMHANFLRQIRHFEQELNQTRHSGETVCAFNETIIDWFFDHVCVQDRALGEFLRDCERHPTLKVGACS